MASIFTYQDEPHRVHSPWGTPGSTTPQLIAPSHDGRQDDTFSSGTSPPLTKLEPEKHDGPIEYKLHLLLRWRRTFTHSSTVIPIWSGQHHKLEAASSSVLANSQGILPKSPYQPSTQHRQARLQQLTTQLLWRLQQSSPFHSSSNQNLVLPVLPEATPRLGMPERTGKLLPGLEESQGALYEIGVADDGTLVGLADEEMEESLTNLRAMAASLGCIVDIHRRVIVGDCAWVETDQDNQSTTRTSDLWVAEVLVRPDNKVMDVISSRSLSQPLKPDPTRSSEFSTADERRSVRKDHLRVTLMGASGCGKSSLLGTLTTSKLDNGRGKSRLSLLKHRHEIASGMTSSVAQELLGYQLGDTSGPRIINYGTGDVSAWPDIHNLADRLIFCSDSPGLARYAKSTFRALISWSPMWTLLCVAADGAYQPEHPTGNASEPGSVSMAHLKLCLQLAKPIILVITKMDQATRTSMRQTLASVLAVLKDAGRTTCMLNTAGSQHVKNDADFAQDINHLTTLKQADVERKIQSEMSDDLTTTVPVIFTSAVSGSGLDDLHALLRVLPLSTTPYHHDKHVKAPKICFRVDEVFAIPPSKVYSTDAGRAATDSGVVLCGTAARGELCLGEEMLLGPFLVEADKPGHLGLNGTGRSLSHQGKTPAHPLVRTLSETFSRSLQTRATERAVETEARFVRVRVVSLRNLRLPVSRMFPGDTGTVGIHFIDDPVFMDKARKGMVLVDNLSNPLSCRDFTAAFEYCDFQDPTSPPLLLGGHALAYVNSIRAAVKVAAFDVENGGSESGEITADAFGLETDPEVFAFEDDVQALNDNGVSKRQLHISFHLRTTAEYIEPGDQVLIIPNASAAGPITGPIQPGTMAGFAGFVGKVTSTKQEQS